MFYSCIFNVLLMNFQCFIDAFSMIYWCIFNVLLMHFQCFIAFSVFYWCFNVLLMHFNVLLMYFQCFIDAFSMFYCIFNVLLMHFQCFIDAFSMFYWCISMFYWCIFNVLLMIFRKLLISKYFKGKTFQLLLTINLPWGHVIHLKNVRLDRFSRFYVCWIQTHERQTSKVY